DNGSAKSGSASGAESDPVEGQGAEKPHVDDVSLKDVINETLQHSVKKALEDTSPNNSAKQELTQLMDLTEGQEHADKIWGDIGAGAIRGETVATRRVEFWKQWLQEN